MISYVPLPAYDLNLTIGHTPSPLIPFAVSLFLTLLYKFLQRKAKLEKIYEENMKKVNELCEHLCAELCRRPSVSLNGSPLAQCPDEGQLVTE